MQISNLRSSYEKVGEIVFFGRMLDKIRLHAQGKLPKDYNRGFGLDGRCLRFLQIDYDALVRRVLLGGTDEEILEWCFENGRRPNNEEIQIWNQFMEKRGWRDDSTPELKKMKATRGFSDRDDILTFFDFHDADEEHDNDRQSYMDGKATLESAAGYDMNELTNSLRQPISFALPDWTPPPNPPRECMEGHFCRLEPLQVDSHLDDLYQANAFDKDGRSWTYLAYGPFSNKDSYRNWMTKTCLSEDPLFFAIVDKGAESACGVASYVNIEPSSGAIEVGHIHYSPQLQRTRIATESMYLMMKKAFELGYRRYSWKCDSLNKASRAAAQRLGLSFEGIFRRAKVYNGRNRDTAWYTAIDSEWPQLEKAFVTWLAPDNFDKQGKQRVRLSDLTMSILKKTDCEDQGVCSHIA